MYSRSIRIDTSGCDNFKWEFKGKESAQDYYPFGMLIPNRNGAVNATGTFELNGGETYRFGFNGKENDNEVKGTGDQQDYGMRIYDPRLGRFLSVDPLTAKYPWYTPYLFAGNKSIMAIDIDGLEEYVIVRWYDPANPNQWVKSTVIKVSNKNDRILGQTGILQLNLMNTEENQLFLKELSRASASDKSAVNNMTFTTLMKNKGIISDNGLVDNADYNYQTSSIANNQLEENIINALEKKLANINAKNELYSGAESSTWLPDYFIGFEQDKYNFNPSLDIDENHLSNQQEINSVNILLSQNPQMTASITGNASSETIIRDNPQLASQRAQTVKNLITNTGVSNNRVTAKGQYTNNPIGNVAKDRNAKIKMNFPRLK